MMRTPTDWIKRHRVGGDEMVLVGSQEPGRVQVESGLDGTGVPHEIWPRLNLWR